MSTYASPEQSAAWLRERMGELGVASLDELAEMSGSDKGNLSRIFRQRHGPGRRHGPAISLTSRRSDPRDQSGHNGRIESG